MRPPFFLFIALVFSSLALSAQKASVINDVNARPRNVGAFEAVEVSDGIDLYISQGSETGLAVSAKTEEQRQRIKTVVENGVLKVYYELKGLVIQVNRNNPLRVYISINELKQIKASGGSDIMLTGDLKVNTLSVALSGGSDWVGGNLKAQELHLSIRGGSDARLSGMVQNLNVEASGGSDLLGFGLVADYAVLNCSGGSDIQITVQKEMVAEASGSSDIHYKGNPQVKESKTKGGSDITHKN